MRHVLLQAALNRYYYSMPLNRRAMPAVNAGAEFALIYDVGFALIYDVEFAPMYDVEFALIYDGSFDISALKVDGSFVLL